MLLERDEGKHTRLNVGSTIGKSCQMIAFLRVQAGQNVIGPHLGRGEATNFLV